MNELTINRNSVALTMSSLEIAGLCEKDHKHVLTDIRKMLEELEIQSAGFSADYKDGQGRTYPCFNLPRRECDILIAGYNIKYRAAIVDRWQELEGQQAPKIPQTMHEALRLAADALEQNAQLAIASEKLTAEIAALQNLFNEGMTPAQFVKGLNGVNCMAINQLLADRKWLFREGGHWRVGSYARDTYLTEQQSQITPRDSEPFVQYKPVLLRKGASAIYKLYLDRQLVMKRTWNGEFTHDTIKKVA
jgi:phage regulator Rha-like protein